MSDMSRVAVIVPAYDPGAELDRCIEAILGQKLATGEFEVVVVDNGSAPPISPSWGPRVRVIREPTPGSYAARNAGIAATETGVLAFTDADCIPQPGWLDAGMRALRSGAGAATGPVVVFRSDTPTVTERYELRYAFPQDHYLAEDFGVTANLFVTRAAIAQAGPFDANLRSGGDREFGQRLARHGLRTEWVDAAAVMHPARRTIGQLLAKTRRTWAGTIILERRTKSRIELTLASLWLLRPPIRAFVRIMREEEQVGLTARMQLCGLLMLVRATGCWASLRTLLGGTSPR